MKKIAVIAFGVAAMFVSTVSAGDKAFICHNTHSETNPFVLIEVSLASLETHITQHGDIAPSAGGPQGGLGCLQP
jgi:hypothetical protein